MKTKIEIDCDNGNELIAHLSVITKQIKAKIKEAKKISIKTPIRIEDSNCYGEHIVTITNVDIDDFIYKPEPCNIKYF